MQHLFIPNWQASKLYINNLDPILSGADPWQSDRHELPL